MSSYQHPPNSGLSALPIMRWARWLGQTVRRRGASEVISWLAWLLAVAVFAIWTHFSYRAPSGPNWIGMTVRAGVFAIWTQVLREWCMLWLERRRKRSAGRIAQHRWEHDD